MNEKCSCNKEYVSWKVSDISYDTIDNICYTDILIWYCPVCGNIEKIEEF